MCIFVFVKWGLLWHFFNQDKISHDKYYGCTYYNRRVSIEYSYAINNFTNALKSQKVANKSGCKDIFSEQIWPLESQLLVKDASIFDGKRL
jgi:hypothetical protein